MYNVRKLKLAQTEQCDALALASGELYSRVVTSFWRTVRHSNVWLKPSSMMRWQNSKALHAHSADAVVQSFYAALKSWRVRRKEDPDAKPPRKRRRFYRVQWKASAIRLKDGKLVLANGKGNAPLIVPWQWDLPTLVELGWHGTGYELRCVYTTAVQAEAIGTGVAGVDLGEIHLAAVHDGTNCTIYNGRYLRSVRRYQNKVKASLAARIDTSKRGSKRRRKLVRTKARILKRLDNQIRDILHKQTTHLVSTSHRNGVQTLVVGDVRDIRQGLDYGKKANQKLHQWAHGKTRWMLTYKAKRLGMSVVLMDEAYTSVTCPACMARHKPRGRVYRCNCGFSGHRDAVGAWNIRSKYLEAIPVVAAMKSAVGVRYATPRNALRRGTPWL